MKLPIAQIIEGHAKEVLGLDTDISEARLKICHRCPLFSNALGGMCNSRLWLNVETGDVSTNARQGYQNGYVLVEWIKNEKSNHQENGGYNESIFDLMPTDWDQDEFEMFRIRRGKKIR